MTVLISGGRYGRPFPGSAASLVDRNAILPGKYHAVLVLSDKGTMITLPNRDFLCIERINSSGVST